MGWWKLFPQIYAESHTWARLWMLSEHPRWCYLKSTSWLQKRRSWRRCNVCCRRSAGKSGQPDFYTGRIGRKKITPRNRWEIDVAVFPLVCLSITVLGIYSAISIDTERRRRKSLSGKIKGASAYVIVRLFALGLYLRLLVAAMVLTFPFSELDHAFVASGFTLHFGHGPAFLIFIVFVMVTVVALTIAENTRDHPGESGGGTEG